MSNIYDPEGWSRVRRVYVEHFGYFYSLTPEQWIELAINAAENDCGYTLDPKLEIRQRPRGVFKDRDDVRSYTMRQDILLVDPLDWTDEDFRNHLATLGVYKTPEEWLQTEWSGYKIMDPDGWRDGTRRWEEPISRDEFSRRFSECTVTMPPGVNILAMGKDDE